MRLAITLSALGIFIVPVGQLEGWLSRLHVAGSKVSFVVNALSKLEKVRTPPYVRRRRGDVWALNPLPVVRPEHGREHRLGCRCYW